LTFAVIAGRNPPDSRTAIISRRAFRRVVPILAFRRPRNLIGLNHTNLSILKNTTTSSAASFTPGNRTIDFFGVLDSSGDFNGDGKPDIVMESRSGNGGAFAFLKNATQSGDIDFVTSDNFASNSYLNGGYISGIIPGDFNNDGKLDLASSFDSSMYGSVAVMLNNGCR
jgi:FG-GAP-like repeat